MAGGISMGISIETLVAAKKFTSETVLGGGAVVGKNVTISSITPINGGNRITFSYTLDNETAKTSTLDVMNGVNGADGKDGKAFTYDDFTEEQLEVLKVKGDKGDAGKDAVSPTITENENNTDTIYKLDVTTVDGTFTTPNLRGKDGKNGSGSSTGEENVIESIKVNGVAQTVAEDKSVDITVPTVDVDKNYVDTELAKKANTSDIPSLDKYVTDEELNAKGYLTTHQDISGKVDKVKGKSLIADTEIERLKSVKNYDDTEIKTELAKKANSTDIPTKVSGLQNDSNYQTDTDVTTTLTPYATKTYVGEQISNADHLKREIVTEIPKPETADKNTIYMLKIESVTGNDKYREYLLIDGTVQCVGDTSVDLTDYAKTTDVDKKLNNKADKTEIPTVPTNVSEFTNDAGYLTEHQDISNFVVKEEGKELSSNDYTSEEKAKLSGVGTSQGRNLISYPYYNGTSYESNGVTYTVNEVDGTITVNGTATKESDFRLISPYDTSDRKTLELGQTYTLSDGVNQPNSIGYQAPVYFQFVRIDTTKNDFNYGISTNYGNMTWTASDANLLQYGIRVVVREGVTADNVVLKPMLEIGNIAHMYEPTTESNVSLKKSIETKTTINDVSTTSTTETWSAKKINEKTAQNFNNRIILSVSRGANAYTDTAHLNSSDGAYLYWSSSAGQEKYSVGVILYVYNGWMIIPIKETDGGTSIKFSVEGNILTMSKDSTTFPCAGGVIALGASI
jgi:hypothetical protein